MAVAINTAVIIGFIAVSIATLGLTLGTLIVSATQSNPTILPPLQQTLQCDRFREPRRQNAALNRIRAALRNAESPTFCPNSNGDPAVGRFSKGLPHDPVTGEVDPTAYNTLISVLDDTRRFEDIVLHPQAVNKLVNPQGGLAFPLIGGDSFSFSIPPAPAFNSTEIAHEFVELLWMSATRDIPFADYGSDSLIARASAQLGENVTFRGTAPGCEKGPYLSQFFYLPCSYGVNTINLKITPQLPGRDYLTSWVEFKNVQNGKSPTFAEISTTPDRYMINGRDLAHWVHRDMLQQAYHMAAMTLLAMNAPFASTNPYLNSLNQQGFVTFGGPFVSTMLTEVALHALNAIWAQKWYVHRHLRPEEYGGRVHAMRTSLASYDIDAFALSGDVQALSFAAHGTYLLPMAFPEGCPLHPSYGSGHATVAGASITVLKALFRGDYVIPNPLQPDSTGANTVPYTGPDTLTVEGELNKIAANIAYGRNIAGVHWRSDAVESLLLGERVAIAFLRDYRDTYSETGFTRWEFNGFQGNAISV